MLAVSCLGASSTSFWIVSSMLLYMLLLYTSLLHTMRSWFCFSLCFYFMYQIISVMVVGQDEELPFHCISSSASEVGMALSRCHPSTKHIVKRVEAGNAIYEACDASFFRRKHQMQMTSFQALCMKHLNSLYM
jgi:hypothetical protein